MFAGADEVLYRAKRAGWRTTFDAEVYRPCYMFCLRRLEV